MNYNELLLLDLLEECSECGHLHFDVRFRSYIACPLDECSCELNDGEPHYDPLTRSYTR